MDQFPVDTVYVAVDTLYINTASTNPWVLIVLGLGVIALVGYIFKKITES